MNLNRSQLLWQKVQTSSLYIQSTSTMNFDKGGGWDISHKSLLCWHWTWTSGWTMNPIILRHKLSLQIFCLLDLQLLMFLLKAVNRQQGAQWYDQNGPSLCWTVYNQPFLALLWATQFLGVFQLRLDHWFDYVTIRPNQLLFPDGNCTTWPVVAVN